MISNVWHAGQGKNYGDSKTINDCQVRWGLAEINRQKKGFLKYWKYSNDIIIIKHIGIHLSKPTDCITSRINHNVKFGLWVIMMCQFGFINSKKIHHSGERCWSWGVLCICIGGARDLWEISLNPPQFCCES